MRRPFQVEAPQGDLLTVDAALRTHLRIGSAVTDDLVATYIQAAIAWLDGYSGSLGRCILKQRWAFPVPLDSNEMKLPFPDCRNMTIERWDGDAFTALPGATIVPEFDRVILCGVSGDRSDVWLLADAGWDTAELVPDNLKQAIRMLVAHWSEHPEAVVMGTIATEVPMGVNVLLQPLRLC